MQWTSIVAIYILVWTACAFLMLPFGVRTHDELNLRKTPGQADSAPANFRPGRLVLRATLLAAVLTGLYVANYVNGWIVAEDLNLYNPPALD
ncbi:DUF1467 family protein [Erythrobacteraceae bacterium CFH 75059]|uniref:DUF1467 family protein n=1 Tax=Qipengyuania thermophila TaxID=2509361 RepID=UPI0010208C00|nr:DUF1467 family protein [Qipengyuania thermophila]TCD05286.1 DUF1467 family protein [Erythrobacteraceae bacterium CFH 75059]